MKFFSFLFFPLLIAVSLFLTSEENQNQVRADWVLSFSGTASSISEARLGGTSTNSVTITATNSNYKFLSTLRYGFAEKCYSDQPGYVYGFETYKNDIMRESSVSVALNRITILLWPRAGYTIPASESITCGNFADFLIGGPLPLPESDNFFTFVIDPAPTSNVALYSYANPNTPNYVPFPSLPSFAQFTSDQIRDKGLTFYIIISGDNWYPERVAELAKFVTCTGPSFNSNSSNCFENVTIPTTAATLMPGFPCIVVFSLSRDETRLFDISSTASVNFAIPSDGLLDFTYKTRQVHGLPSLLTFTIANNAPKALRDISLMGATFRTDLPPDPATGEPYRGIRYPIGDQISLLANITPLLHNTVFVEERCLRGKVSSVAECNRTLFFTIPTQSPIQYNRFASSSFFTNSDIRRFALSSQYAHMDEIEWLETGGFKYDTVQGMFVMKKIPEYETWGVDTISINVPFSCFSTLEPPQPSSGFPLRMVVTPSPGEYIGGLLNITQADVWFSDVVQFLILDGESWTTDVVENLRNYIGGETSSFETQKAELFSLPNFAQYPLTKFNRSNTTMIEITLKAMLTFSMSVPSENIAFDIASPSWGRSGIPFALSAPSFFTITKSPIQFRLTVATASTSTKNNKNTENNDAVVEFVEEEEIRSGGFKLRLELGGETGFASDLSSCKQTICSSWAVSPANPNDEQNTNAFGWMSQSAFICDFSSSSSSFRILPNSSNRILDIVLQPDPFFNVVRSEIVTVFLPSVCTGIAQGFPSIIPAYKLQGSFQILPQSGTFSFLASFDDGATLQPVQSMDESDIRRARVRLYISVVNDTFCDTNNNSNNNNNISLDIFNSLISITPTNSYTNKSKNQNVCWNTTKSQVIESITFLNSTLVQILFKPIITPQNGRVTLMNETLELTISPSWVNSQRVRSGLGKNQIFLNIITTLMSHTARFSPSQSRTVERTSCKSFLTSSLCTSSFPEHRCQWCSDMGACVDHDDDNSIDACASAKCSDFSKDVVRSNQTRICPAAQCHFCPEVQQCVNKTTFPVCDCALATTMDECSIVPRGSCFWCNKNIISTSTTPLPLLTTSNLCMPLQNNKNNNNDPWQQCSCVFLSKQVCQEIEWNQNGSSCRWCESMNSCIDPSIKKCNDMTCLDFSDYTSFGKCPNSPICTSCGTNNNNNNNLCLNYIPNVVPNSTSCDVSSFNQQTCQKCANCVWNQPIVIGVTNALSYCSVNFGLNNNNNNNNSSSSLNAPCSSSSSSPFTCEAINVIYSGSSYENPTLRLLLLQNQCNMSGCFYNSVNQKCENEKKDGVGNDEFCPKLFISGFVVFPLVLVIIGFFKDILVVIVLIGIFGDSISRKIKRWFIVDDSASKGEKNPAIIKVNLDRTIYINDIVARDSTANNKKIENVQQKNESFEDYCDRAIDHLFEFPIKNNNNVEDEKKLLVWRAAVSEALAFSMTDAGLWFNIDDDDDYGEVEGKSIDENDSESKQNDSPSLSRNEQHEGIDSLMISREYNLALTNEIVGRMNVNQEEEELQLFSPKNTMTVKKKKQENSKKRRINLDDDDDDDDDDEGIHNNTTITNTDEDLLLGSSQENEKFTLDEEELEINQDDDDELLGNTTRTNNKNNPFELGNNKRSAKDKERIRSKDISSSSSKNIRREEKTNEASSKNIKQAVAAEVIIGKEIAKDEDGYKNDRVPSAIAATTTITASSEADDIMNSDMKKKAKPKSSRRKNAVTSNATKTTTRLMLSEETLSSQSLLQTTIDEVVISQAMCILFYASSRHAFVRIAASLREFPSPILLVLYLFGNCILFISALVFLVGSEEAKNLIDRISFQSSSCRDGVNNNSQLSVDFERFLFLGFRLLNSSTLSTVMLLFVKTIHMFWNYSGTGERFAQLPLHERLSIRKIMSSTASTKKNFLLFFLWSNFVLVLVFGVAGIIYGLRFTPVVIVFVILAIIPYRAFILWGIRKFGKKIKTDDDTSATTRRIHPTSNNNNNDLATRLIFVPNQDVNNNNDNSNTLKLVVKPREEKMSRPQRPHSLPVALLLFIFGETLPTVILTVMFQVWFNFMCFIEFGDLLGISVNANRNQQLMRTEFEWRTAPFGVCLGDLFGNDFSGIIAGLSSFVPFL